MKHNIVFVDAYNLFMRMFSTIIKFNNKQIHIGALYGVIQTLSALAKKNRYIFMIWDGENSGEARRKIFPEYKQGRRAKHKYMAGIENLQDPTSTIDVDTQAHFDYQYKMIQEVLNVIPVYNICLHGLEADDIISYMVREAPFKNHNITIFSGDKDYYQLLNKNQTIKIEPKLHKFVTYKDVVEKFEILPENFSIARSIIGDDASDGIIGVKGVGFKRLIKAFPELKETPLVIDDIFLKIYSKETRSKNEQDIFDNLEQILLMHEIVNLQEIDLPYYKREELFSNLNMGVEWKPLLFKMLIIKENLAETDYEYSGLINNFSNLKHNIKDLYNE